MNMYPKNCVAWLKNVNILRYAWMKALICLTLAIQDDFSVAEEMLDLIPLHGTTKGTDIFEAVNKLMSDYGGFDKCSCIVTDVARAMTGTEIGFAGLLKQNSINCPMILYCSPRELMWKIFP
ncbi:unnamed protein product [Acanthoscelides obtectus]|uniref:DUF4371 domain-containing protein n=1 Tax=Acanthoscelides obtectus TaxID=200917 RepID=A0A9P0M0H8_ACAOB|nr:unnamed protein product [Acanthoscelides obtectus]CAK1659675.1 hypothetical protein AOBTE_LOCUS21613 [Acanthoscelides obtectus]